MNRLTGILWGMLSGASFGLIPLFTLPLMEAGLDIDSVLFYRFSTATLLLGVILAVRGENFRITKRQIVPLLTLGCFYMASSLFLLWGYQYMAAGVATTVHFLYPVCVVLLMVLFFGERASLRNLGAVILAILGVALLSSGDESNHVSTVGLVVVVISAVAYALYIIGIKRFNLGGLGGFKLTFFVMIITSLMFLCKAFIFGTGIIPLSGSTSVVNVVLLAFIPTVVSNFALVNAVKIVGSTTTSILGALEPMTAMLVGVLVFREPFGFVALAGMVLVIGAVTTIVLGKQNGK